MSALLICSSFWVQAFFVGLYWLIMTRFLPRSPHTHFTLNDRHTHHHTNQTRPSSSPLSYKLDCLQLTPTISHTWAPTALPHPHTPPMFLLAHRQTPHSQNTPTRVPTLFLTHTQTPTPPTHIPNSFCSWTTGWRGGFHV